MPQPKKILRKCAHHARDHRLHAVLEISYLSFHLMDGFSIQAVFVAILMVHTALDIFSREA